MTCPNIKCGIEVEDADSFCERCGEPLRADAVAAPVVPPAPPPQTIPTTNPTDFRCACGAGIAEITKDGECSNCGRQRIVDGKIIAFEATEESEEGSEELPDNPGNPIHSEQVLNARVAVVSDLGAHTKHSNQDFGLVDQFVVGSKTFTLAIVCDGISTALNSAMAAKVACETFALKTKQALSEGEQNSLAAVRLGIEAAQIAVLAVPFEGVNFDAPETTLVAALIEDNRLATFGWVGDSRAYLLIKAEQPGRFKGKLVTHDHSWVNREVESGRLTMRRALQSKFSSMVLSSLGPLRPDEVFQPSFNAVALDDAFAVLLCCDGIHKYVDPLAGTDPGYWHELSVPQPVNALALANTFVDYANFCGGGDNNTAAVIVSESASKSFNQPTAAK